MLPLSAHFTMFEDKCIWYPDERSNYAFYDECLTKLLLITALLLFGVMSVSINIHRAARINKRRLNSERKHGGIWKRMRTLYVCIFAPLLASLCQHFLILGAVCCTLRICKLKTSSSSSLRTAEREREKKSLPLNCLRWQKWHSGLNIYQLHEINELGEMQKKNDTLIIFQRRAGSETLVLLDRMVLERTAMCCVSLRPRFDFPSRYWFWYLNIVLTSCLFV